MMTPQLFINYKMKSVAHLPWRMLTYKALNTFIDDLFAFVIKMPTLYRIGCFRDGRFSKHSFVSISPLYIVSDFFSKHALFLPSLSSDIIFFIYLYQKYTYKEDPNRVNEFGTSGSHPEGVPVQAEVTGEGEF